MTHLTLYTDAFWISPYVFTCFVALKEKGLEFETRTVALQRKEQHDRAYLARSITGRVPALDHGDFSIAESSAIVEYLEDAFPDRPRLLPADPRDRARARQILAWIRSDLDALRAERPTTTMFYEPATTPLTKDGEKAAQKLARVAEALLPDGRTKLFDAWSIADADLAFMLHRLILNGHPVSDRVRAFADANWSRPSIHGFVVRSRPAYEPY